MMKSSTSTHLSQVHCNSTTKEVLDFIAVGIGCDPTRRPGEIYCVVYKLRKDDECDVVQSGGVEPANIGLVAEKQHPGNCTLKSRNFLDGLEITV